MRAFTSVGCATLGARPVESPVIVCPDCGRPLLEGERMWRCRPCTRVWPATLGIPDLRPRPEAGRPPVITRLLEAYPRASFLELAALRVRHAALDDSGLGTALFLDLLGMREDGGPFLRVVRARLAERWPAPRPGLALVIGCRAGSTILDLAGEFERVVGIDSDLADLILAKKAAEERGLAVRITLVQGSVRALPLADGVVDLAIAADLRQGSGDLERTFFELGRVLAPGGQLAGCCGDRRELRSPGPHVRLRLVGRLARALREDRVRWRRRLPDRDEPLRLPSGRELQRALRAVFGGAGRVVVPRRPASGPPRGLDRLLGALERLGPLATALQWIASPRLAIARKGGEGAVA